MLRKLKSWESFRRVSGLLIATSSAALVVAAVPFVIVKSASLFPKVTGLPKCALISAFSAIALAALVLTVIVVVSIVHDLFKS